MQRTELTYSLPIGFIEGSAIEYRGMGHQDTKGAMGDVKLQFHYQFPEHWRRASIDSLDLICDVFVQQRILLAGANITVAAVNGQSVKVSFMRNSYSLQRYVALHLSL
jgi:DnaJ-class molecular chaperone